MNWIKKASAGQGTAEGAALQQILTGWAIPVVLLAGAALRIAVWWQNRSLFIDEANLARNFCGSGLAGFFQPLAYDQYAPPLFCVAERLGVRWFGQQEYALRAFLLLCSLAAIPLFYRVAKQLISNAWVFLAVAWIFSFSEILLRYATEAKQYGCDAFAALALLAWCLQRPFRPWATAVLGAVVLWFSMPSAFMLFGAGLYYGRAAWLANDHRPLAQTGLVVLAWCASFLACFILLLRPSLGVGALAAAHESWFFPLIPDSAAALRQARDLLMSFPYYTAGHTVLALGVGAAGILSGFVLGFRRNKAIILLIAVPVLTCIAASGFKVYSMAPRLLVWGFPLLMLAQGVGWQWWWNSARAQVRPVLLLLWVATAGLHDAWRFFAKPYVVEEIRPVMQTVAFNFREGDVVYVNHETWPAVAYYTTCYSGKDGFPFAGKMVKGAWDQHPAAGVLADGGGGQAKRIWLLYSHLISNASGNAMKADLDVISGYARQTLVVEQPGACAYLFVR